ncbi:MAG: MFS transporter [Methanobacteriaceae archaeon]|nr:MFS transporter [Methanobacteriaceae archaeon]
MDDEVKAILISALLTFIGIFNYECITITLPYLSVSLGISSVFANWIYLGFFLACSATGLFFGKFTRKYGIVRISLICVVLGIIGSILCIFTFSPYFIIVGNMLHGVSASGTFATLYVFIYRKVNIHKVGSGIGIATASGFLGTLLAPLIGGFLSLYFSWILVYLFTLPFLIIVFALLISFDDEWVDDVSLDKIGSIIWAITMILFIYGVTYLSSSIGFIAFILSLISVLIFVVYELKANDPLLDLRVFKNYLYTLNVFTALMTQFIKCGSIFVLTLYLQYVSSYSALETGILMGFYAFIMILISLVAGKLSDSHNPIDLTNYGLIFMFVSLIMLCFIDILSIYLIVIALVLLAIGLGIFETPNKKILFETSENMEVVDSSALLSTVRDIGSLSSSAIFTLVLGIFIGIGDKIIYWSVSSVFMFKIILVVTIITMIISFILSFRYKKIVR